MPVVRPFRALRYAVEAGRSLGDVIAPPYDVIGEDEHRRLLARHPNNVVRLDFPMAETGDADGDERYRRAARTLAAWRGDGVLRQDSRPSVYVYEQAFTRPGGEIEVRRGFFARVRLEPFGDGIRAHERTLAAPREDRYRLLRATNVNTSPIVAMYDDPGGAAAAAIETACAGVPIGDAVDDHDVRHRVWQVPVHDDGIAEALCAAASAGPLTIADGHHRYETALRYRDERRVGAPEQPEAAYDSVLMLLLEPIAGPLVILPTHRVVGGLDPDLVTTLPERLEPWFTIDGPLAPEAFLARFGETAPDPPAERGRIGLWTRQGGWALLARRDALEAILPPGSPALRSLDVSVLGAVLAEVLGIDADSVASGRIAYTKDAHAVIELVADRPDVAGFLLAGTPASAIMAVAGAGEVMPQKSTYIYPKAATGLVINVLEG